MKKDRFEMFSDGVIAIIITIIVIEMKVPLGETVQALVPMVPVLLSYILSFIHLGIYWSNHHHMLHVTSEVTGPMLWANLHLLFWLSLIPFTTSWMGENHFAAAPVALYGLVLLFAAIAYRILQQAVIALQGPNSSSETPSAATGRAGYRSSSMPSPYRWRSRPDGSRWRSTFSSRWYGWCRTGELKEWAT